MKSDYEYAWSWSYKKNQTTRVHFPRISQFETLYILWCARLTSPSDLFTWTM